MNHTTVAKSTGTILRGLGKTIERVPDIEFFQAMKHLPQRMAERLAFMSRDHHMVRDFAVREMPREQRPLSPAGISGTLGLNVGRVNTILAELEANLFFLVRNSAGDVSWAFPVTTSPTQHRLSFSTGEKTFGA